MGPIIDLTHLSDDAELPIPPESPSCPPCLWLYLSSLVPHPDPRCQGYWKIRGSDARHMLAESREVPGQVGVYADAWSPPSSARPSPRVPVLEGVAVFQDGDIVSDYAGVRYSSRVAYDSAHEDGPDINRYLWESSSGRYLVDDRPSMFSLHY